MTFQEAVHQFRAIRRKAWTRNKRLLSISNILHQCNDSNFTAKPWLANVIDIAADDWEDATK